jgi:hypothetical protein
MDVLVRGTFNLLGGVMRKQAHMLPVWFFVGVLLATYGVIILYVALVDFRRPSNVALAQYHPDLFGGILLLVLGGIYTYWFWPGRHKN